MKANVEAYVNHTWKKSASLQLVADVRTLKKTQNVKLNQNQRKKRHKKLFRNSGCRRLKNIFKVV